MGVFSTAVRRTSEEKVMEHGTVAPTKNICLNYAIDVVFSLATIYMPTCFGGKTYLINYFFPYLVLRHRNQHNNLSKVINNAE